MENIHIDSGVNFASRTKLSSGIKGLRLFASQGYQQLFSLNDSNTSANGKGRKDTGINGTRITREELP